MISPTPTTNLREPLIMEINDMELLFMTLKEIDQELLEKKCLLTTATYKACKFMIK